MQLYNPTSSRKRYLIPLPHRRWTATLRQIPHIRDTFSWMVSECAKTTVYKFPTPKSGATFLLPVYSSKPKHLLEYAHSARIPQNPLIQTHPSATGAIRFSAVGFRFFSLSVMSTFQFSFAVLIRYRSRIMYLDLDGMHHPLDTSIPRCATRKQ